MGTESDSLVDAQREIVELRAQLQDARARLAQRALWDELLSEPDVSSRLIDAIPGGIVHVLATGAVHVANDEACRVLGLRRDELTRRYTIDFETETIREDGTPCPNEDYPVTRALVTGESQPPMTIGVRKPDGEVSWAVFTAFPVRDPASGEVTGAFVTFVDITAHKLREARQRDLEVQLRHQQRLESVGTLASGVAHEINNPIQGIMNYAELIRTNPTDVVQTAEFAGEVVRETERVAAIVRDLLTFARAESVESTPVDVETLVSSTLSLIRTILRKDGIELEVDIPGDLPPLHCRHQPTRQALMNLLTNARDALNSRFAGRHPEKCIRVDAATFSRDGSTWIRLGVTDRGAGVAPADRERIFDPFFTTKARYAGTGLGLSVSLGIITEQGGELRLVDDDDGETRFVIELPAG